MWLDQVVLMGGTVPNLMSIDDSSARGNVLSDLGGTTNPAAVWSCSHRHRAISTSIGTGRAGAKLLLLCLEASPGMVCGGD